MTVPTNPQIPQRADDLPQRVELLAVTLPRRGRRPFADAVETQHCCPIERAEIKGRSGMRLVMLGEQQVRNRCVALAKQVFQLFFQRGLEIELLLEPDRHGREE